MMLQNKVAIVYGGGGAIGGAVARAFAREGAELFLAGRTKEKLDAVANDICSAGGRAEISVIDALNERDVAQHSAEVSAKAGGIDIAFNALGIKHVQGIPLSELSAADFLHPITAYATAYFITARAVTPYMASRGSGVIMMLSTPGARMPGTGFLGYGVSCAATEGMTRLLAAELAPAGVRVVCIRSHAIPEASAMGSHSRDVFEPVARSAGVSLDELMEGAAAGTLLKRLPTLDQVASAAVFAASAQAASMTGTVINLTCGAVVD
ncbi:SDR family NAD(P)-dependent oxidoreductase [Phyllobacterium salinisoli]|uniref:SDR family NAD(P)-dependent oxidoreductase n=1 Tax=Phyllobacterium salinisoli TaxID=1899321 RepID=A0A368K0Z3_9HYPH|nr:SDR family NAD(P)-dependent oxidoreductase [Phyllobacterium salinisoli]RCS23057.1 SDR family NAD(P)-dependent oxidoreductase [Phyllobacterium salinisoli]